ncbi:MAG TPA: GNAT family N-acetyltransferase [Puia sp.]|nr:GNAT family N-acetyltransferase [Puia sp.]
MQFHTRFAEMDDARAITDLSEQWGYQSTKEKILRCLHDIRNNTDHVIYVLLHNDQMIGWAHGVYSLRIETDPFVEIGGLVVDKDFRRQGAGKFLVDKIVEWSLLRDCHMIRVRCNIIREEANAFYGRIGFKEIKQQKVYDMKV